MRLKQALVLGTMLIYGCINSEREEYIKDKSINVERYHVNQEVTSLDFNSGCNHIHAYQLNGPGKIDRIEVIKNSPRVDCINSPQVQEVEQLIKLVDRYSSPEPVCKIYDSKGELFVPSRLDAEALTICYQKQNAGGIKKCLEDNSPTEWKVECK